jgi:hypothetical protein
MGGRLWYPAYSSTRTLPTCGKLTSMPYRVTPHRLLTRNPTRMHCTRTVYYVVHGKPPQRYPLRSGHPFRTFEAARMHAHRLSRRGYAGWIMRVREWRQEDWPAEQWLIDHGAEEPIVWIQPF